MVMLVSIATIDMRLIKSALSITFIVITGFYFSCTDSMKQSEIDLPRLIQSDSIQLSGNLSALCLSFHDQSFVCNINTRDSILIFDTLGVLKSRFEMYQNDQLCQYNPRMALAKLGSGNWSFFDDALVFDGGKSTPSFLPIYRENEVKKNALSKISKGELSAFNAPMIGYDESVGHFLLTTTISSHFLEQGATTSVGDPAAVMFDTSGNVMSYMGKVPAYWFNKSPVQVFYREFSSNLDTVNKRVLVANTNMPGFKVYRYNGKFVDSTVFPNDTKRFPVFVPTVPVLTARKADSPVQLIPKEVLCYSDPVYWPKLGVYTLLCWSSLRKEKRLDVMFYDQDLRFLGYREMGEKRSSISAVLFNLDRNTFYLVSENDKGLLVNKVRVVLPPV